jgi:hypothetical protein
VNKAKSASNALVPSDQNVAITTTNYNEEMYNDERKWPASNTPNNFDRREKKRPQTDAGVLPEPASSNNNAEREKVVPPQIHFFSYVETVPVEAAGGGGQSTLDYRVLVATYADLEAASEDDPEKAEAIEAACQAGGGFMGDYFYQYEVSPKSNSNMLSVIRQSISISFVRLWFNTDERAGVGNTRQ